MKYEQLQDKKHYKTAQTRNKSRTINSARASRKYRRIHFYDVPQIQNRHSALKRFYIDLPKIEYLANPNNRKSRKERIEMGSISDNSRTRRSVSAKREAPEVYERRQDSVLAGIGLGIMCNSCALYNLLEIMPQNVAFALFNFGAWPTAFAIYRTWRRWKEQDTGIGKQDKSNAESFDEERMLEF